MTIIRYTSLIIIGLGFLATFIVKVIDFRNQQINPIKRETTYRSIEANSFSIVFCVDVKNDGNQTFSIIEQQTNKVFNESFENIYLDFENKKKRVELTFDRVYRQ